MEETLVLLKPDAVARNLAGEIIARFERRGLKIIGLKLMQMTREKAEKHYAEHAGKPFFADLVNFITSGPIVAMALKGENAIQMVRTMMGPTNPVTAAPGTIRGDYARTLDSNIIHGSDSPQSAEREVALFFSAAELVR